MEVLKAERDICKRLEEEKDKARKWLSEVQKQVEEETIKEQEALKESFEASMQSARAQAVIKAQAIVQDAEELAKRLRVLDDSLLTEIVRRRIAVILPHI